MEKPWRDLLAENAGAAIHAGPLRSDLDVGQFLWDLCGIYLSHHAAARFLRDPVPMRGRGLRWRGCLGGRCRNAGT